MDELVAEALDSTGGLPPGDYEIGVGIDDVAVRWYGTEGSEVEGRWLGEEEILSWILDALQDSIVPVDEQVESHPELEMAAELLIDLNDGGRAAIQVICTITDGGAMEEKEARRSSRSRGAGPVARGDSHVQRLPRLYCHGCRDSLRAQGSSLLRSEYVLPRHEPIYSPSFDYDPKPGYVKR